MKNLILIRHAKSCWETTSIDKERPLNEKGIKQANLVAEYALNIFPSNIEFWSSTAKRAAETAKIFAKKIHIPFEKIIFKEELYTFNENLLEKNIQSIPNEIKSLVLFGHNGAITNFVNKFGTRYIENVPTSGVVFLKFDTNNWKNIKKGVTKHSLFPKSIE